MNQFRPWHKHYPNGWIINIALVLGILAAPIGLGWMLHNERADNRELRAQIMVLQAHLDGLKAPVNILCGRK